MPPELDGDQTAQTPSATPDVTPAASSSGTDANPAPSSGSDATSSKPEPKSMADAISAAFDAATSPDFKAPDDGVPAVDPDGKPDAEATAKEVPADDKAKAEDADKSKETGEEPGAEADDEELPDPTKEELAALPPNPRRRVKQLLAQRLALREQVKTLEPDATGYRTIRQFMASNNLADPEVAELFQFGADLKSGDPVRLKRALDAVMPHVTVMLEALGQVVPADLRARVDNGEMTEEAAKEFARTRFQAATAQTRAQAAQQQVQQQTVTQAQEAVRQAVVNWQTQTRASDPDFDLKQETMMHVGRSIVAQRGAPRTAAEAVQYAKEAYQEATRLLTAAKPTPQPTRPTPTGVNGSPNRTGVKQAPASLADAIGQAFDQVTRPA